MLYKYVPIIEKPKETLSATKNKRIWGAYSSNFINVFFAKCLLEKEK